METFETFKAIQDRISVRTYSDRPVEIKVLKELERYIKDLEVRPFGTKPRFKILDMEPLDKKEMRGLGTYGFIKNARLYILSAIENKPGAMEDLGFCFESIILKATSLGLGTCWLGGTFKRAAFAEKMNLRKGELLPAISPLGYPAEETNVSEQLTRLAVKAKKRKPWSVLFFANDGKTTLSEGETEPHRDCLEAVRLAPSATNRQPWRIIKGSSGSYHLYLAENKLYNRFMGKIRLQNIDMGIAMCHFALVAREQNLPGKWQTDPRAPEHAGLQYIATWSR